MHYRDARVKIPADRRRRCRALVRQISSLQWERIRQCDLCGKSQIVILANRDRYGISLQAGMFSDCGLVFLLDRLSCEGYVDKACK